MGLTGEIASFEKMIVDFVKEVYDIVGGLDWCSIALVTTKVLEISGKLNKKKSAFT
jgi:hypothetical protein